MINNYANIPIELRKLPNWVCADNNKIPKNPRNGLNARPNDPSTWGTFAQATVAREYFGLPHIGFNFSYPYFGVDLDHTAHDSAIGREFTEGLKSYSEISQSGKGMHIICKGNLPGPSSRRGNVEIYSGSRYFVMTGNTLSVSGEINDCTDSVAPLYQKYLGRRQAPAFLVPKSTLAKLTLLDHEIIEKGRTCQDGGKFADLYDGLWQKWGYPSQSEADFELCRSLAWWTRGDTNQIERIFRSSALYRPKWDEKRGLSTYGQRTIDDALNFYYTSRIRQDEKEYF